MVWVKVQQVLALKAQEVEGRPGAATHDAHRLWVGHDLLELWEVERVGLRKGGEEVTRG